jgi:rhodanese-related sulfurtransferase
MKVFVKSILCVTWLLASTAIADVKNIDEAELIQLIEQDIPVIDIRRQDEWERTGTIQDSHLLTFFDKNGRYDAKAWLAELNKLVSIDEPFILICAAGVRSNNIAQLLDGRLGYTGVHNVRKGIQSWIAKGQPVVPYKP